MILLMAYIPIMTAGIARIAMTITTYLIVKTTIAIATASYNIYKSFSS